MNENDWLTTTNLGDMISLLFDKATARQARLFACACARRVGQDLLHPASLAAVAVAERCADGLGSRDALTAARRAALAMAETTDNRAARAARDATRVSAFGAASLIIWQFTAVERGRLCGVLRCIMGNPFAPPPAGRFPDHVVGLART